MTISKYLDCSLQEDWLIVQLATHDWVFLSPETIPVCYASLSSVSCGTRLACSWTWRRENLSYLLCKHTKVLHIEAFPYSEYSSFIRACNQFCEIRKSFFVDHDKDFDRLSGILHNNSILRLDIVQKVSLHQVSLRCSLVYFDGNLNTPLVKAFSPLWYNRKNKGLTIPFLATTKEKLHISSYQPL